MKVLHVISGLKNGGAEAILYRISVSNSKISHIIVSLGDQNQYYVNKFHEAGISVYILNITSILSFLKGLIRLRKIIIYESPDILQSWMYHADLAISLSSIFLNVNVIYGIHSTFLNPKTTKTSTIFIVKILRYFSAFIPQKIICCSEIAMNSHIELGFKSSKMIVINNGIDITKFAPNLDARLKIRSQLEISDETIVIGMIARWDINKNHKLLFSTLNKLISNGLNYNFKLLLAGDSITNDNQELNYLLEINNLIDKSYLIGSIDNIEEYVNALDLHVLTSDAESFGNVTAECLACGIEVISTDVGLCREFIIDGLGQIVQVNNSEALLESLHIYFHNYVKFKHDTERKYLLRKNIVESFSQEDMIENYNKLWNKIYTDARI